MTAQRIPDADWLAPLVVRTDSQAEALTHLRAELERLRTELLGGVDRALVELERAWRQLRLAREQLTEHQHG